MSLVIDIKSAPEKHRKALNAADYSECGQKDKQYNGKIDQDCEVLAAASSIDGKKKYTNVSEAEAFLKKTLGITDAGPSPKTQGTPMIGNKDFFLEKGKLYPWGGAEVIVESDRMIMTTSPSAHSGIVHEYGVGDLAWNGKPISIAKYSKLIITVEVKKGDIGNVKFEMNDDLILDFGRLKPGENVIDLNALKKREYSPINEIRKINFVSKPAAGQFIIRMSIQ